MDSVNLEEMLSLDESFDLRDGLSEDEANDAYAAATVVVPCVGRGMNMISISDINLPADFYADVQPAVSTVQMSSQFKSRKTGKGRAQVIHQDKIKCSRQFGNHPANGNNLPGNNILGGDYRQDGSSVLVENSLPYQQNIEAQKSATFDEDYPPLSGSDKPPIKSDKPDTSHKSQGQRPDSLSDIAKCFIAPSEI